MKKSKRIYLLIGVCLVVLIGVATVFVLTSGEEKGWNMPPATLHYNGFLYPYQNAENRTACEYRHAEGKRIPLEDMKIYFEVALGGKDTPVEVVKGTATNLDSENFSGTNINWESAPTVTDVLFKVGVVGYDNSTFGPGGHLKTIWEVGNARYFAECTALKIIYSNTPIHAQFDLSIPETNFWSEANTVVPDSVGSVWFNPDNGRTSLNYFLTVMKVNSGNQEVGSYEFTVSWNDQVIDLDTVMGENGVEVGEDGFLSSVTYDSDENIVVVRGVSSSGSGPGSQLDFLVFHWMRMGSGESPLDVEIDELKDVTGENIGTPFAEDALIHTV